MRTQFWWGADLLSRVVVLPPMEAFQMHDVKGCQCGPQTDHSETLKSSPGLPTSLTPTKSKPPSYQFLTRTNTYVYEINFSQISLIDSWTVVS